MEQVAAAAGWPPQKIERFAYPVLLERSRTAEVAQRAHPMRADGPDSRVLADVVAHTFGLRGQEFLSAEWDSWKGDDGRWVVALSWRAGRSDNRALWTFQPGAHGGTVTAIDEHAHDLVEGLPARPLRTVGPVIDISRPDEQPPPVPEEGHELRAAASDIAARRDVSDWSRTAPEPRRPESPRRSALSRPEPSVVARTRTDTADEPATDWPVAQRDTEIRDDDPARLGDTTKRGVDPAAAPAARYTAPASPAPPPAAVAGPGRVAGPGPGRIAGPGPVAGPSPDRRPEACERAGGDSRYSRPRRDPHQRRGRPRGPQGHGRRPPVTRTHPRSARSPRSRTRACRGPPGPEAQPQGQAGDAVVGRGPPGRAQPALICGPARCSGSSDPARDDAVRAEGDTSGL